jgi:Tfp pilus assembly protein PilZ
LRGEKKAKIPQNRKRAAFRRHRKRGTMKEFFKDTRHHRRFNVEAMDIRGLAAYSGKMVINDISISGISIKTDRKMAPGESYTVKISSRDREIYLEGKVIWSMENRTPEHPDESPPLAYAAGLQFGDLGQEIMTNLMKFITFHRVEKTTPLSFHQKSWRRANVRFRLGNAGETTLCFAEAFKVRILSLGGMLIEKNHPYAVGSEFQMQMILPGDVNVAFVGKVISCSPAEDRPGGYYDVGIKISALPDQDRAKLKELIRWLYLKDAGFTE